MSELIRWAAMGIVGEKKKRLKYFTRDIQMLGGGRRRQPTGELGAEQTDMPDCSRPTF